MNLLTQRNYHCYLKIIKQVTCDLSTAAFKQLLQALSFSPSMIYRYEEFFQKWDLEPRFSSRDKQKRRRRGGRMCGCYINPALNCVQRFSIVPSKSQMLQTRAHVATNSLYIPMKQTFLQLSLGVTVFSFLAFFFQKWTTESNLTSFVLFSKQYLYQIISDSFVLAVSIICSVDNLWPTGRVSHAAVEALHYYRHSRTQSTCDLLKAGPLETVVAFDFLTVFLALSQTVDSGWFVSFTAACWGVYDRWGTVLSTLVGKRQRKYKKTSDASPSSLAEWFMEIKYLWCPLFLINIHLG